MKISQRLKKKMLVKSKSHSDKSLTKNNKNKKNPKIFKKGMSVSVYLQMKSNQNCRNLIGNVRWT